MAPDPGAAPRECSVVAFGGGHGLHASLSALRRVVTPVTAVVTVADDGGSSGRLREEFGVLPPGDLRMALAALCGDDEWGQTWARVLQHRFAGEGEMRGHVVGNLLIVGLWELLGDPVRALDWVGRLLGASGRVLPMALTPMQITAEVSGLAEGTTEVRGQVQVATTTGTICSIALDPPDPVACPEAVAAVRSADWVVLGPGSWFTSVIPHLMVPELRRALAESPARLLVVLNLEAQAGETGGFDPADHLSVLLDHAPDLRIDTVLADIGLAGDPARNGEALRTAVEGCGARLVVGDIAVGDGTPRHDPVKLAAALDELFDGPAPRG